MSVSIDIPLHASLPGGRERSTLHHWAISYGEKGNPVKDCRDRGVCSGCFMNELNWENV